MRTKHFIALVCVFVNLSIAGLGCSTDSANGDGSTVTSPPPPTIPPNTVLMAGTSFSPSTLTVAAGTTVTWKNNDVTLHTSTSDTGFWDTGKMAGGASTTTTFNTPGTFTYHCFYHAAMGMTGTIVVN